MRRFASAALLLVWLVPSAASAESPHRIRIVKTDAARVDIYAGEALFASYHYGIGLHKPIFHPLLSPEGSPGHPGIPHGGRHPRRTDRPLATRRRLLHLPQRQRRGLLVQVSSSRGQPGKRKDPAHRIHTDGRGAERDLGRHLRLGRPYREGPASAGLSGDHPSRTRLADSRPEDHADRPGAEGHVRRHRRRG